MRRIRGVFKDAGKNMGQIYRVNLIQEAKLLPYEEKILRRHSSKLMIPFTIIRDEKAESIVYITDGLIPISQYEIKDIGSAFTILQSLIESYVSAQRHMIDPFRFFSDREKVFVSYKDGRAFPMFGNEGNPESKEMELVLPIINELASRKEIVCIKDAMESVVNKIRGNNLGLKDILRVAQTTQREWNLILPSGFDGNRPNKKT